MIALDDATILAHLPFVTTLARRLSNSCPLTLDFGDLVQEGVLGLIDAARHFDPERGIAFETYAEPRVRGAMIDPLRRAAWPRVARRQRRELDAARESLRKDLGGEPTLAELAARLNTDVPCLRRRMLRLRTMEATAPTTIPLSSPRLQASRAADMAALDIFRPWRPDQPDTTYEKRESSQRMMAAIHTLPRRERKLIGLYYYRGHSLKEISVVLGIHESRASQLHLRAIKRLRTALSRSGVTRTAEN